MEHIQQWLRWHEGAILVVLAREDGEFWAGVCLMRKNKYVQWVAEYSAVGESVEIAVEALNNELYERRVDGL